MSKPICAFAIPHDDRFNYLYQAIYAAVAIEAGFEPQRMLDLGRRNESIREAWDASAADLAVVDLTNSSGQPYYYLALRQLQGNARVRSHKVFQGDITAGEESRGIQVPIRNQARRNEIGFGQQGRPVKFVGREEAHIEQAT